MLDLNKRRAINELCCFCSSNIVVITAIIGNLMYLFTQQYQYALLKQHEYVNK